METSKSNRTWLHAFHQQLISRLKVTFERDLPIMDHQICSMTTGSAPNFADEDSVTACVQRILLEKITFAPQHFSTVVTLTCRVSVIPRYDLDSPRHGIRQSPGIRGGGEADMFCQGFLISLALSEAIASTKIHHNHNFSYRGPEGFEFWADKYPNCRGKRQSPINIDTDVAQTVKLKPLFFSR